VNGCLAETLTMWKSTLPITTSCLQVEGSALCIPHLPLWPECVTMGPKP
jgi:hypothetical protein